MLKTVLDIWYVLDVCYLKSSRYVCLSLVRTMENTVDVSNRKGFHGGFRGPKVFREAEGVKERESHHWHLASQESQHRQG